MLNPTILMLIEKNPKDIEAIITTIGIGTILKILPNILNILGTVQAADKLAAGSDRA
jgi:hypothetical protein